MDINTLKGMNQTEILDFIRLVLIRPGATELQDHYRFDMSGYESKTGECTIKNLEVLNKFAFLGIYDYTTFLFIDFYKGTPTLYFQYFWESNSDVRKVDYCGHGTTSIIYEILKLTVLSGRPTRRRI